MGKLISFAIQLSPGQLVYYPGQVITGDVKVNLKQPMEMEAIEIKLKGKGECHWKEERGTGDDRRTVHFKGKETIMKEKAYLFGSSSSDEPRVSLPEGEQSFNFSLTLPTNIPSSYEDSYGYIRYTLKAKIDKPWKFDHKVKQVITVNDLIDPNHPKYGKGKGGEKHKDVGVLCCKAGPLDLSASIDRGAYCPGETIFITANVTNQTNRDMDELRAKLNQIVIYHAKDGTKTRTRVISKLDGPIIPSGECASWENQPFSVPSLPPTIANSKVISIKYNLEVEVDIPWGFDPTIKLALVIGTVPYMPTYGQSFDSGSSQNQTAPLNATDSGDYEPPPCSVLGYPDIPPPSYSAVSGAEEVNIAKGDKDTYTYGKMKYTPVYIFAQPYQRTASSSDTQMIAQDQEYPNPQPTRIITVSNQDLQ